MQLNRLVNFHKCLADPIRIRILVMLNQGPLHGQALAGKLGVTPPTITHHMTKLREAGLVYQRREKNTIYFNLDEKNLKLGAQSVIDVVNQDVTLETQDEKSVAITLKERTNVIQNFFSVSGRLKHIPAQRKKKLIVFEHIIQGLQAGKKYTEQEINAYIMQFHEDYATIRREFIMNHYMYRESGVYELNPKEMWAKIR